MYYSPFWSVTSFRTNMMLHRWSFSHPSVFVSLKMENLSRTFHTPADLSPRTWGLEVPEGRRDAAEVLGSVPGGSGWLWAAQSVFPPLGNGHCRGNHLWLTDDLQRHHPRLLYTLLESLRFICLNWFACFICLLCSAHTRAHTMYCLHVEQDNVCRR